MTSRQYDAIDEHVSAEIKRLHKRHPKLGHDGLLDALRQQNIHVDPQDLEAYMKHNRIKPERLWRGWALRGAPAWLIGWGGGGGNGGGGGWGGGGGGADCGDGDGGDCD